MEEQMKEKFVAMVRQRQMTVERFNILTDVLDPNADLGNRAAVRAALGLGALPPQTLFLTVDYGLTIGAMIAAGLYDLIKRGVDWKRFRNSWLNRGAVTFDARYFGFDHNVSSEHAIETIESADRAFPWRLAGIEPLLALGATFPEEQRKFKIAALGSPAKVGFSGPQVPYLGQVDSKRNLGLYRLRDSWPPIYRFLAVRVVGFQSLAA